VKDGTLYTGQTADLAERVSLHNRGLVQSTRSRRPWRLGYFEQHSTRSQAMWREWELKRKWNTARKKNLIATFDPHKVVDVLGL
jgi:putative endonuclease